MHSQERALAGLIRRRCAVGFKVRNQRRVAAAAGVAEALHLLLAGRELLAAGKRLPLLPLPPMGNRTAAPGTSTEITCCEAGAAGLHLYKVQLGPVLATPQHEALGRQAVTPGAPDLRHKMGERRGLAAYLPCSQRAALLANVPVATRLLVVGLQGGGRAVVDDPPDVGLVNACAAETSRYAGRRSRAKLWITFLTWTDGSAKNYHNHLNHM